MKPKIKKIIALVLIASLFALLVPARPAKADIWGESLFAAMTFKQMLEEIYKKIEQSMLAALRSAAIKIIQSRLLSLIGGGGKKGGSPGPISSIIVKSSKSLPSFR